MCASAKTLKYNYLLWNYLQDSVREKRQVDNCVHNRPPFV